MTINYIHGGSYEIMPGFGHDGSLIFKAATTCYKNEEHTKKTVEEFIEMLKANNHTAMFEFMWIVLEFKRSDLEDIFSDDFDFWEYMNDELMLEMNKYLDVTYLDGRLLLSGNGRAFYNHMLTIIDLYNSKALPVMRPAMIEMIAALRSVNPVLFAYEPLSSINATRCRVLKEDDPIFTECPDLRWYMVKFYNVSRGLTHELVRHRVMSFAQVSTRYVDHTDMDIIFPLDEIPEDLRPRVKDAYAAMQSAYAAMLERNVPKGIARQILPTGIGADICVAGDYYDWMSVFALRAPEKGAAAVHWEILDIMTLLKKDLMPS